MNNIIYQNKMLYKKVLKNNKYIIFLNELQKEYYNELQKECNHNEFIDKGYYKTKNGNIYKTDKKTAEFRYLKCCECQTDLNLLKNINDDWDIKYGDIEISIIEERKKVKIK